VTRPLGIFSYFGYESPLAARLELIRRAGFGHTSLWWGPDEALVVAGRRRETPAMARDQGLVIEYVHAPFVESNQLWDDSPAVRETYVRRHREYLDDCVRLGLACLVLHVTHGAPSPGPTAEGVAAFERLVGQAEQAGVTLAIENTRRDDIIHRLLEEIPSPRLKFCYDSGHDWLWGHPPGSTLARWGGRLAQTHFADCDGPPEDPLAYSGPHTHDRHLLPGDGRIDWPALAKIFPQSYTGCLLLEVMPRDLSRWAGPEEFLIEARRRLEWVAGLLGCCP